MLSRALAFVLAAALAVVLLLAGGQQAALAGGGPGSGSPYGGVTCGQSYAPQCTVTAGSGPSAGTPASAGTQAGGQPAAGTAAGGGAAGGCQGTVNKTFGCVPAGCQVTVQTLACPIGAAAPAGPAAGAGPAPPDPAVLAALARQTLGLPSPVIRSSPAQDALQLTNLPTWLWINPAEWVPESKTATVPGESVTATATPVSVTWHPGDGSTVTCQGAGTPYTSADNPAVGVAGLRAHLHQLQRRAAGRRVPGDGHDHLGRHLAGGRRARAGRCRRCSRPPWRRSGSRSPRR